MGRSCSPGRHQGFLAGLGIPAASAPSAFYAHLDPEARTLLCWAVAYGRVLEHEQSLEDLRVERHRASPRLQLRVVAELMRRRCCLRGNGDLYTILPKRV